MSNPKVQIQRLPHGEGIDLPFYATTHAAGADLRAAVDDDVIIQPGDSALIKTGFAMALPDNFEAQVRPRSGLALKFGITVLNTPGTIDADYRGEVMIAAINLGPEPYTFHRGDRVAQMVIHRVHQAELQEVEYLDETRRNTGGFGHTGK